MRTLQPNISLIITIFLCAILYKPAFAEAALAHDQKKVPIISVFSPNGHLEVRLGEGTKEGFYPLQFPQTGENKGMGGTSAALGRTRRRSCIVLNINGDYSHNFKTIA